MPVLLLFLAVCRAPDQIDTVADQLDFDARDREPKMAPPPCFYLEAISPRAREFIAAGAGAAGGGKGAAAAGAKGGAAGGSSEQAPESCDLALLTNQPTRIGRSPDNEIQLPASWIQLSTFHCQLTYQPEEVRGRAHGSAVWLPLVVAAAPPPPLGALETLAPPRPAPPCPAPGSYTSAPTKSMT